MNISHIIFDRHGVLDKTTFAKPLTVMSEATWMTKKDVLKEIYDIRILWDSGQVFFDEVSKALNIKLGIDIDVSNKIFNHIMTIQPNTSLWELLSALSEKYILSILSDCPPEKTEKIHHTEDLSLFKQAYFSSDHDMTKDADEFFLKLLHVLGLNESQYGKALFVDDSPQKIAKAKKIGLHVCQFATIDDLTSMIS